jgi:hypothetical protein
LISVERRQRPTLTPLAWSLRLPIRALLPGDSFGAYASCDLPMKRHQRSRTVLGMMPAPWEKVEAAARQFGALRLRRAALWTALQDLQSRPRTADPPRIFISYRWEDEAIKAWCHHLADHLRRRGYEVLLDLEHLVDDLGPGGIEIPGYVAALRTLNVNP